MLQRVRTDIALPEPRAVWEQQYVRGLRFTDAVAVVVSVAVAQYVRFGIDPSSPSVLVNGPFTYTLVSIGLALLWIASLAIYRTRSPRVIGTGSEEYRRITSACMRLFGLIAIAALVFRLDIARGYLAIAFPAGLMFLILSRFAWRVLVKRRRTRGGFQTSVIVVGSRASAMALTHSFNNAPSAGYNVVGVCLPGYEADVEPSLHVDDDDVPVLGDDSCVLAAIAATGADTVAVTATEHLGSRGIRSLAWDLEKLDVDLVVSPGVADVAGPRLLMRPVADLPLIHVEKPQYNGAKRFSKTAFDMVFAMLALVLMSPILVVVAIAVKATSRGPVLYRSERIGLDGHPFRMIKFRSMVDGADRQVASLQSQNESGGGVLFKIREDPRVTPVGKFMRRYSIDELPQFLNVLTQEMSVVGPRPPLRREVETYDGEVRRRLLVKPGITGLWQVSGRSDLSWDETVRLDLSYVENWSMIGDIAIILKTLKAVVGSDGAY
ncbi:sugar transferase [Actinomycetes bacterium M1A6_2h]